MRLIRLMPPGTVPLLLQLGCLAAVLFPTASFAQAPPLWEALEPGPYPVGYRVLYETDRSRVWEALPDSEPGLEFTRPIRTSVWYPAQAVENPDYMTFGEYIHDPAPNAHFRRLRDILETRTVWIFRDAAPELWDTLLTLRTAAIADAPAAGGEFPLVMYASGGGASVPDNGSLAAYLASHGYVVAAVPQLGSTSAEELYRDIADGVETQARDIEFAMGLVMNLPGVNRRKVAIAGYSFGGSVAIRVAGRNPNVDAVVGLDASFVSGRGSDLDIKQLRMPMLSLYAGQQEAWAVRSGRVVDSLHYATRYLARVADVTHGDFTELRGMLVPLRIREALEDDVLAVGHRGYKAVCQYVLHFLNGVLKGDQAGLAFAARSSAENDMDAGLVEVRRVDAVAVPTEEEFVDILERDGIDVARRLLQDAERDHPYLDVIDEQLLNQFGYGLLNRDRHELAVVAFQLNTAAHARSANAFDSLGDAYLATGDSVRAIEALERVIELLPADSSLTMEGRDLLRRRAALRLRLLRP